MHGRTITFLLLTVYRSFLSSFLELDDREKYSNFRKKNTLTEHPSSYIVTYVDAADHSGHVVEGMKCLPPEHWDRGFESRSRHGCLFVFILCLCYVAVLGRAADPSSKESYRQSKD
jgi:hypothetical protein